MGDRDNVSLMLAKKRYRERADEVAFHVRDRAALAAMISASPAQAGGLKQVAEISIPGDPITDIGIMATTKELACRGCIVVYGPE